MRAWRFHPPFWAIAGVVVSAGFLCALGLWQVQRGQAKQKLLDQVAASAATPAQALGTRVAGAERIAHVHVRGRYDEMRQLLLDNQSHQQKPGFQVWTPMRLEGGEFIIVNRGWIPLTNRAQLPALPAPTGLQDITGYWQPLPKAGLSPRGSDCVKATTFPFIVNYPTHKDLVCLLGETIRDGELLLEANMPSGYVRVWTFDNGFPPTRHYGYAVQWFALAVTLIFLFIKLNLKRVERPHE